MDAFSSPGLAEVADFAFGEGEDFFAADAGAGAFTLVDSAVPARVDVPSPVDGVVALYSSATPQPRRASVSRAQIDTAMSLPKFVGSFCTLANTPDETFDMVLRNFSVAEVFFSGFSAA